MPPRPAPQPPLAWLRYSVAARAQAQSLQKRAPASPGAAEMSRPSPSSDGSAADDLSTSSSSTLVVFDTQSTPTDPTPFTSTTQTVADYPGSLLPSILTPSLTHPTAINITSTPVSAVGSGSALPGSTGAGHPNVGAIVGAVLGTLAGLALVAFFLRKASQAHKPKKDKKLNPWDKANLLQNMKNEEVHVTTAVNQRYVYPGLVAHSKLEPNG